ncbi:MAG: ABC transporter permease [Thermoleophilaceae bacterium]
MLRFPFKGLAPPLLRAAGTVAAVFLGVALIAGTYILTDTIDRSFDDIFTTAVEGTDIVLTPEVVVDQETEPPPFPDSVLDTVRQVDGVQAADGGIFSIVRITDAEGDTLGADFAPQFVVSTSPEPFDVLTYTEGREPRSAGEAAIDASNAEREGIEPGDAIGVVGTGRLRRYRVVGINKLGDTATGGSSTVTLVPEETQDVVGKQGKLDRISVAASPGVSTTELKRRIARAVPRSVRVESAAENAARRTSEIGDDLGFLKVVLLVFSGVALVVGGFVIFNTFSITVAQRIREFGLLRTLGASRAQLLRSVLAEALLIGLAGSALGLLAGLGFASGINSLLTSIGIDLPNTGTVIAARTVVVALVVGVLITVASSLAPALRATRVSPMEALRDAALPESRRRGHIAAGVAALLGLGGLAMVLAGLFGGIESADSAASLMGGGAALVLFAVSLYSPRLVTPLAAVAGRPLEWARGLTGRLARENATRRPGRTAVTAAALMIGVALVVFVAVFAAGINRSVATTIDRNFTADLTVQNIDGFSPIPRSIERDVRAVPGVEAVSALRFSEARVRGQKGEQGVAAIDPPNIGRVFRLELTEGDESALTGLGDDEAIVDENYAQSKGVEIGDTLEALTPTGRRGSYRVVAEVEDRTDFLGSFVVTQRALERDFGETRNAYVFAAIDSGEESGATARRVERLIDEQYPAAEALDQEQLKQAQEDQINQLLGLVYALLSLAVIVSVLGIVNTLALSIHERTRELGMLRAVGMSRRQVRQIVRYEAVITALIGAILGTVLGVLFAALISRPLAEEGFELAYPVGTLVMLLVLAALAGVLAAILPARRAARLDVLDALAYE